MHDYDHLERAILASRLAADDGPSLAVVLREEWCELKATQSIEALEASGRRLKALSQYCEIAAENLRKAG